MANHTFMASSNFYPVKPVKEDIMKYAGVSKVRAGLIKGRISGSLVMLQPVATKTKLFAGFHSASFYAVEPGALHFFGAG